MSKLINNPNESPLPVVVFFTNVLKSILSWRFFWFVMIIVIVGLSINEAFFADDASIPVGILSLVIGVIVAIFFAYIIKFLNYLIVKYGLDKVGENKKKYN